MTTDVIEIDRVPVEIKAVATRERAELLTRRIRSAISDKLTAALSTFRFHDVLADDAYVFIERLGIECQVGAHWRDDLVGQAFGEALLDHLHRQIESGAGIRFADRAEYVAAFLAALLDGAGHSRWWFAEFDGLKPLPLSAALRTLVINEGETGIAALTRLTDDTARRVSGSMTPADGGRLLEHVIALRRDVAGVGCESLCRFVEHTGFAIPKDVPEQLARWIALERFVAARIAAIDLSRLQLIDALFSAARAGRLQHILVQAGSPTILMSSCLRDIGEVGGRAPDFSDNDCAVLIERLMELSSTAQSDEQQQDACSVSGFTPFGGALLLLVRLLRLQWWQRWRDALQGHDNAVEFAKQLCPALALMVVAEALDPKQAKLIRSDEVLLRAFCVNPAQAVDTLCREHEELCVSLLGATQAPGGEGSSELVTVEPSWEEALATSATELLTQFAEAIPGCVDSSAEYLRKQCLAMPATLSIEEREIRVRLGRPPLDVLLGIAGIKRASAEFPDHRKLILVGEITR